MDVHHYKSHDVYHNNACIIAGCVSWRTCIMMNECVS